MAYVVCVSFELNRKQLSKVRNPQEHWIRVDHTGLDSDGPVSKLVGASLTKSKLIKRVWGASDYVVRNGQREKAAWIELGVESMWIQRLRGINSIMTLMLRYPDEKLPPGGLQRLSSSKILKVLEAVGLAACLDKTTSVYSVVGSLAPVGDDWLPLTKDGWLHIQGTYIHEQILRHVVMQVAIERSILNSAVAPRRGLGRLFAPAIAASRVRQWPIEFLTDWESISDSYRQLRSSLNLPAVRAEVLEQGKHWWTVASVVLGLAAVVIALVAK